jgi:hypothetical protein
LKSAVVVRGLCHWFGDRWRKLLSVKPFGTSLKKEEKIKSKHFHHKFKKWSELLSVKPLDTSQKEVKN